MLVSSGYNFELTRCWKGLNGSPTYWMRKDSDEEGNIAEEESNEEEEKKSKNWDFGVGDEAASAATAPLWMRNLRLEWGTEESVTERWERIQGQSGLRWRQLFSLVKRKGVYPYDFCDGGLEQLEMTTKLPEKEAFYNKLKAVDISDEDYGHAQKVWHSFRCRHLLDYTMLYCLSDIYLLADAIHQLRGALFKEFRLDMLGFLSFPQMAKSIMLHESGSELELLSCPEAVNMLRQNVRGGLSFIGMRLAELDVVPNDNEDWEERPFQTLFESYDGHILYLDANNLYGQ